MQVSLIPTKKAIIANKLQEVSDPILFEKGNIPTARGLLSTEIFGISVRDRKVRFAYIALHGHFMIPIAYKSIKRMDRKFEHIINATKKFVVNSKGELIEDEENGGTGLEFLYQNWDKIKFSRNTSLIRDERIDVFETHDRDTIFTEQLLVIPAFYRDVNLQSISNGKISHHEINDKYAKAIRYASTLKSGAKFSMELDNTRAALQNTLVEIYDLLKERLEKKNGLLRKSLLGRSVEYGARAVISAPLHQYDKPEDSYVDLHHAGIPLSTTCAIATPFIIKWVKDFFRREFETSGTNTKYPLKVGDKIEYVTVDKYSEIFDDTYIKKSIDRFIFSPGDRFMPVKVKVKEVDKYPDGIYITMTGRFYNKDVPETESPLASRPITWCDILYQAAVEVTADKHVINTRFPLLDYFGTVPFKITVMSTHETVPMYIGNKVYPRYPVVDLKMPKSKVEVNFIDTVVMSNLVLDGLGGDYDGDQVSVKMLFSQEANKEAESIIQSKSHLINIQGRNMRKTTNEAIQTLYSMTAFRD